MEAASTYRIWNCCLPRSFAEARTSGQLLRARRHLSCIKQLTSTTATSNRSSCKASAHWVLSLLSTSTRDTPLFARGNATSLPSSSSSFVSSILHQQQHQKRAIAMSSKLIPSNPADLLVIRDVTPNVTTLSLPFSRFGILEVGGRCTIVRLTSGGVLVYSPVALTPEATAVVKRLDGGQGVKYLVAPDMEHHIFLSEWRKAYPDAKVLAPDGLAEKRAATKDDPKVQVPEDKFFAVLRANEKETVQAVPVAPDFDADFSTVYFDTHRNKEIVLLYKPDGVLIEADLFFNLPAIEQYSRVDQATRVGGPDHPNFLNRLFQNAMTTSGTALAARRVMWYLVSSQNRSRFNEGLKILDNWSFNTVIPCHGEVIEGNAKQVFREFFAWHLTGKKDD